MTRPTFSSIAILGGKLYGVTGTSAFEITP
jgi:hypothetical protein